MRADLIYTIASVWMLQSSIAEEPNQFCGKQIDLSGCKAEELKRYYFFPTNNCCYEIMWFQCGGPENIFTSFEECEKACWDYNVPRMCLLDKDEGRPLYDYQPTEDKYFFNKSTQECESFTYKGAYGNGNNFESKNACERFCIRKVKYISLPEVEVEAQ